MKKLLIFSDMDGTIDRATADDFVNFFEVVYKYCDEKDYGDFSFYIVTGAWDDCCELYDEIFSCVEDKLGRDIDYAVFPKISAEDKRDTIDYMVSFDAKLKGYEYEIPEKLLAKEVIFFDDAPHESLRDNNGKEYFESKYDLSFKCIIPTRNIYSLIDYFQQQLTSDDKKGPYVKK